jgi:hypothetical protein
LGTFHFAAVDLQSILDRSHERRDGIFADRPTLTSGPDPILDLAAVECFATTVAFDDAREHLFDSLKGGETGSTMLALATPPYRRAIVT